MNKEFKFRYLMNDVRNHILKKKKFFDSMNFEYIGNDMLIDIKDVDERMYRVKLYNYDLFDIDNKDFIEKMTEIVLRAYEQDYLFKILSKGGVTYEQRD